MPTVLSIASLLAVAALRPDLPRESRRAAHGNVVAKILDRRWLSLNRVPVSSWKARRHAVAVGCERPTASMVKNTKGRRSKNRLADIAFAFLLSISTLQLPWAISPSPATATSVKATCDYSKFDRSGVERYCFPFADAQEENVVTNESPKAVLSEEKEEVVDTAQEAETGTDDGKASIAEFLGMGGGVQNPPEAPSTNDGESQGGFASEKVGLAHAENDEIYENELDIQSVRKALIKEEGEINIASKTDNRLGVPVTAIGGGLVALAAGGFMTTQLPKISGDISTEKKESRSQKRARLKDDLFSLIEASKVNKAAIDEAADLLIEETPIRNPTDGPINGKWILKYSTEGPVSQIKQISPATQISQNVDLESGLVTNRIGEEGDAVWLKAEANLEVQGPQRIFFKFAKFGLNLGDGIRIPLPVAGAGWSDSLYLDEDSRIVRNSVGDLLIYKKDNPALAA